jgi:aminopeptidase N
MTDARPALAPAAPHSVLAKDYRPPEWLVPEIALDFQLDATKTWVRANLSVTRNGTHTDPLRLDGDGLTALTVKVDGNDANYEMDGDTLVIHLTGDTHTIETEVEIAPQANTKLMGLYASSGLLCTQCEAEGFRRITFFPDRPDVLSRYRVRMEADASAYPVLLANGDNTANGKAANNRHWAEWNDPFPKPCYLFALVAGKLSANKDSFTTMSGRTVDLGIWVKAADVPRTRHAMAALKTSMKWDEDVYGREYDLDVFNIVAVDDFNFGAMENKGLNVFNSAYILAEPDTATDVDYDNIAGVVAHEYFHNWSGDRVTCRDWFQLSLKEGFTVFRDQSFSADQGSAAVQRINDVRVLRAAQFPEDAGPLAHPIRPESYLEIGNFYTATIYNKGAEVIRMMATLLGPERFRAGTDCYFATHDGQAVTCEDFVLAMEQGGAIDLTQFRLWYSQAGTPRVAVKLAHDAATSTATLTLTQTLAPTPGQTEKAPMHIPFSLALFDPVSTKRTEAQLLELSAPTTTLTFPNHAAPPILSLNRGFSAPIIVDAERSAADLAFLSAHDDDPFARYEAMQQLMLDTLVAAVSTSQADHTAVIEAVRDTLLNPALDPAFKAEAILLPSEAFIGDQMLVVDPEAIAQAREALRMAIGKALHTAWRTAYAENAAGPYIYSPQAKGARRLRNVALGFIQASGVIDAHTQAFAQFSAADNMTDRLAALAVLANSNADERVAALDIFYNRYKGNALVIDKWFSTQAISTRGDTGAAVAALKAHPDFTLNNPNRVRALIGAFTGNQRYFHAADGAGYALLADTLIALDPINPQTAAKLTPPLGRWRRFDIGRQDLMRAALERILAVPGLSKDVFEQASKSLG